MGHARTHARQARNRQHHVLPASMDCISSSGGGTSSSAPCPFQAHPSKKPSSLSLPPRNCSSCLGLAASTCSRACDAAGMAFVVPCRQRGVSKVTACKAPHLIHHGFNLRLICQHRHALLRHQLPHTLLVGCTLQQQRQQVLGNFAADDTCRCACI